MCVQVLVPGRKRTLFGLTVRLHHELHLKYHISEVLLGHRRAVVYKATCFCQAVHEGTCVFSQLSNRVYYKIKSMFCRD